MEAKGFLNVYPAQELATFLTTYDPRVMAPAEVEQHNVTVEPLFTLPDVLAELQKPEFQEQCARERRAQDVLLAGSYDEISEEAKENERSTVRIVITAVHKLLMLEFSK